MPYTWLLFDADDTLFDYKIAEEKSLKSAFDRFGIPFDAEIVLTYREINHTYWAQFEAGQIQLDELRVRRFTDLFQHFGIEIKPDDFSKVYLNSLGQVADLIPGVLETLAFLHATHQMAIITNGIKEVQYSRLSKSPINTYFSHIFISDEIGISKPAKGFFDAVFRALGEPPKEQVLVIGDSLTSDIAGGIQYGLDTCWFNPLFVKKPDELPVTYEIRAMHELVNIVHGENGSG